jgi:hypothetical protein
MIEALASILDARRIVKEPEGSIPPPCSALQTGVAKIQGVIFLRRGAKKLTQDITGTTVRQSSENPGKIGRRGVDGGPTSLKAVLRASNGPG